MAVGAFLLFLANFVAITFSAMIVFMILGHRATIAGPSVTGKTAVLIPRLVCLSILVLLGFHLFNVFQKTFGEATLDSRVRQTVEQELLRFPGSSIVNVSVQGRFGQPAVLAAIKSPHQFSSEEVGRMNDLLDAAFGEPVDLHLRTEMTVEMTRSGAAMKPGAATEPRAATGPN